MRIDVSAPLVARREIFIEAPIETVWRLQCDIGSWPVWQPGVTILKFNGDLSPGVRFQWRVDGVTIKSTLGAVDPPRHIGWISETPGMRSVHVYHLEAHGKRTRVVTEESRAGWSARLLRLQSPSLLEPLLDASLLALKEAAEAG